MPRAEPIWIVTQGSREAGHRQMEGLGSTMHKKQMLLFNKFRSGETSAKSRRNVKEEEPWFCFLAIALRSRLGVLE